MIKRSENHIIPTFSPQGYIIMELQRISEDLSESAERRRKARAWFDKLTMADSLPATPIQSDSGGRRRSHSAGREFVKEAEYQGYDRPYVNR